MRRSVLLVPETEDEWLADIMRVARTLGWKVVHFHDSRREVGDGKMLGDVDAKGWPDLFAIKGDRMLAVELKSDDPARKPTPEQWAWLKLFEATGKVETFVWRPCDAELALAVLSGQAEAISNLDGLSPGVRKPRGRAVPALF